MFMVQSTFLVEQICLFSPQNNSKDEEMKTIFEGIILNALQEWALQSSLFSYQQIVLSKIDKIPKG